MLVSLQQTSQWIWPQTVGLAFNRCVQLSPAASSAALRARRFCIALKGAPITSRRPCLLPPPFLPGPGQFEIALGHAPALQACDSLLLAMEAVAAVARKHSMLASFLPKLLPGQAASGLHCHFRWEAWVGGWCVCVGGGGQRGGGGGGPRPAGAGQAGLWRQRAADGAHLSPCHPGV
jgi:hypothetical protein